MVEDKLRPEEQAKILSGGGADLIILCFKKECLKPHHPDVVYLYSPKSSWTAGRNELLLAALQLGYHEYFVFFDGDTILFRTTSQEAFKKGKLYDMAYMQVRAYYCSCCDTW